MSHRLFNMSILRAEDWNHSKNKLERYVKSQNNVKGRTTSGAKMVSGIIPNHQFGAWMDDVYANEDNEANINFTQQKLARDLAKFHYDPIQTENLLSAITRDPNITISQAVVSIVRYATGTAIGAKSTLP
jgi:hypothetical protein